MDIERTRQPEVGVMRFLTLDTVAWYSTIISHWALLPKRPVKLDDFLGFELITLVQIFEWEKVVERTHPVYEGLVKKFYANFNNEIDIPSSEHLHQTWVREKWIMFSLEEMHDYYQLSWNNVVPILDDFIGMR